MLSLKAITVDERRGSGGEHSGGAAGAAAYSLEALTKVVLASFPLEAISCSVQVTALTLSSFKCNLLRHESGVTSKDSGHGGKK